MQAYLPDERLMQTTSEVDYFHWNYKFPIKYVQRYRFNAILRLMNGRSFGKLLEVGTGSGIFLPELSKHCQDLCAIDIHSKMSAVEKLCAATGIKAGLSQESLMSTHFGNDTFDAIVGISVWEFIDDLEAAVIETKRIMKRGASLFTICPQRNALLDAIVSLYSRIPANKEFKNSPGTISAILRKHFVVEKKYIFPPVLGWFLPLYHYHEYRKAP
jgi:ubiquinone/menaquinone biosynthesis C-methylase UbiE